MPEINLKDTFPGSELGTDEVRWVADFLKLRELEAQAQELERQMAEIFKQPPTHEEALQSIRAEWQARRSQRLLYLKKHFQRVLGDQPSLAYMGHNTLDGLKWPNFIEWSELEEAVRSLPEGIGEVEKRKKIAKLEKQKAELQRQIEKHSPRKFFDDKGRDLRELFVSHWQDTQGRVNSPCGPDGQSLEQCGEDIQKAWKLLNLQELINPESKYQPRFTRYQQI
jgi:hypothetical protein